MKTRPIGHRREMGGRWAWALLALVLAFGSPSPAQPPAQATYVLDTSLAASGGGAPDLVAIDPLAANTFETATVFGDSRTVYRFDGNSTPAQNAGLSLDVTGLVTSAYSVEMVISFFERQSAWRRILDASNRSSDAGFYVSPGNSLNIFPVGGGPTPWINNDFHHVVITNDGAGQVTAYLDGVFQFDLTTSVMDLATYAGANPDELLVFFADNTASGGQGEFTDGYVALIRLYDVELSSDDVADLGVDPDLPGTGCADPADVDYGGFTAADCAGSVVKARNQTQLDAYLADFGVGGGSKPKHLNVLFNPAGGDVEIVSPCRVKLLGVSKLIDVAADNVCVFGRAGVTIGAGTPAAGSAVDAGTGTVLMVSEEGKVQTRPGIDFIAGDMGIEASTTADVGGGSTVTVSGPLTITSDGTASTSHALIQPGSTVMADSLAMTAPNQVRLGDNTDAAITGDLTLSATGGTPSSAAEIQQSSIVVVGGGLDLSGFSCQIAGLADVDVTGTATLAASGSATASAAEILSGATLTAAGVIQTAEHKAVLSGGATVDAGAGNAEIEAPVCAVAGTVVAGSTSGSCLP